jgi:hypothetical protein
MILRLLKNLFKEDTEILKSLIISSKWINNGENVIILTNQSEI